MSKSNPPRRTFRLSDEAQEELLQIWNGVWEIGGSIESADHLIEAINERFSLLEAQPFIGRNRDEIAPGICTLASQSGYLIYYRVDDAVIEAAHVAHGSRLPENVFGTS